jgi:hypothetical protein
MRVPKLVLRLIFRGPRGVSRRYDAIVSAYHQALRNGGQAGRFAPPKQAIPGDPAAYRRAVLARHHAAIDALAVRTLQWTRQQVDSILMPHPLLGNLTVREMLLFTLYHNLHHVHVVARRRGEYFSDSTPLNE